MTLASRDYGRGFMHVVVFSLAIVATTLVLHELGHFASARALGCTDVKITLLDEAMGTFTEMQCAGAPLQLVSLLPATGMLFIIPFVLGLFFLAGHERNYAFLSLGFNLLISISDFAAVPNLVYMSAAAGLTLLLYGEHALVNTYLQRIDGFLPISVKQKNTEVQ